jgi:GT2 family glycosyltransferase/SAM-dependent methyltransferase
MACSYGAEYYQHSCGLPYDRSEPHWAQFFGHIADEMVTRLAPRRVLDAGCAKGFLVEALRDRGVEAFGFDISAYAIGEVRKDIRRYCWVGGVTDPIREHYDLITCIEVLEHVPEAEGRAAIRNMAQHAGAVLFSSTPSDFQEPTHVNVRPILYWLKEFREAGFAPDLNFDAGFVAGQAVLLRRSELRPADDVLELFARSRELVLELEAARAENARQAQVWAEALAHSEQDVESGGRQHEREVKMLRAELEILRQAHAETAEEAAAHRHEAECLLSELDVLQAADEEKQKLERKLTQATEELNFYKREIEDLQQQVDDWQRHVTNIETSFGWRLVAIFRSRRDRYFPAGTRRRAFLDACQHAFKAVLNQVATLRRRLFGQTVFIFWSQPRAAEAYQRWIKLHEPGPGDLVRMREAAAKFAYRPVISIVTPVYNTDPQVLRACLDSVRNQVYPDWELCICDDGSPNPEVRTLLAEYEARDGRIKARYLDRNCGIGAASTEALALASGEFVGFLDHDDELSPDALYEVVHHLQEHRNADILYSDEDKLEPDGRRVDPFFKPDWSPELFLTCMYTCHFSVYRKALVDQLGGLRAEFAGSQDYDLMLRASEATGRIHHIPKVLYHWRKVPTSVVASSATKPYAYEAARRALAEHVARRGLKAEVLDANWVGYYRVKYEAAPERVSIIIPTRDKVKVLRQCIESIEARTQYPDYEILVVDNNSSDPETKAYFAGLRHKVLSFPGEFNFSKINNYAARHATGRYLLFLNNDTEVISPEWISALVEFAQQKEIGSVGAKLLFPNGTIQHAGVVLGLGVSAVAGHPLIGFPADSSYYFGLTGAIRNCSAVTAACLLVRREVFEQVGGFDEDMPVAYNDVDFCLRLRQAGYRNVWTPYAVLYHHESATRGYGMDMRDVAFMKRRWGRALLHDPYYNPNLSLQTIDYALKF